MRFTVQRPPQGDDASTHSSVQTTVGSTADSLPSCSDSFELHRTTSSASTANLLMTSVHVDQDSGCQSTDTHVDKDSCQSTDDGRDVEHWQRDDDDDGLSIDVKYGSNDNFKMLKIATELKNVLMINSTARG